MLGKIIIGTSPTWILYLSLLFVSLIESYLTKKWSFEILNQALNWEVFLFTAGFSVLTTWITYKNYWVDEIDKTN